MLTKNWIGQRMLRVQEQLGNASMYLRSPREFILKQKMKKAWSVYKDLPQLQKAIQTAKDAYPDEDSKYRNIKRYIALNERRIYRLRLNESAPLNILDIGAGAGFFSYLATVHGHHTYGLDLPHPNFYGAMHKAFGLERAVHQIQPQVPLPQLGQRFDLIVAFAVCFNAYAADGSQRFWSQEDWKFFLDDLRRNHAAPNARLHLEFHNTPKGSCADSMRKIKRITPAKTGYRTVDIVL